jgi:hypothetical protein
VQSKIALIGKSDMVTLSGSLVSHRKLRLPEPGFLCLVDLRKVHDEMVDPGPPGPNAQFGRLSANRKLIIRSARFLFAHDPPRIEPTGDFSQFICRR